MFFFEVPQNFLGTKIVRIFVCSENPDFCSLFFFVLEGSDRSAPRATPCETKSLEVVRVRKGQGSSFLDDSSRSFINCTPPMRNFLIFWFSKEANAHGASVVSIKEACDNLSLLLKTYLEPH